MSISYQAYLQSEDWRQKRLRVIAIYRGHCVGCGRQKPDAQLQIHHEEYGQDLRHIPISKLKPMCFKCHDRETAKQKARASQGSPEEVSLKE